MGFYVRAMCESLVKNLWRSGFPDLPCHYWPAKWATWKAHAGIWRVIDKLDFVSDSWLRPSCEWPVKPTACCFLECDFSHSLPTLYKPSLPMKCKKKKEYFLKKLLRGETLAKHLRVRDCFTHNPLHHFSKVSIYTSLRGS